MGPGLCCFSLLEFLGSLCPAPQAMANMASALSRMGPELLGAPPTRFLLAAFDAHAAGLPPAGQKPQEAAAFAAALKACGVCTARFRPTAPPGGEPLPVPASQPHLPTHPPVQRTAGGLRDATNAGSWSGTDGVAAGGNASSTRAAGFVGCAPAHPMAELAYPAGLPSPPRCHPGQQQLHPRLQQLQHPPCPPPLAGAPPPPPYVLALPLAGGPPLSISQYAFLAQQLAGAARAPSPHNLPQPVLVAPIQGPLHAGPGLHFGFPPPPVAPAGGAGPTAVPSTTTDPAHLQRILQLLQSLKVQRCTSAPAAGVPLVG